MKKYITIIIICFVTNYYSNGQVSLTLVPCDKLEVGFPQANQGKSILNLETETIMNVWQKIATIHSNSTTATFNIETNGKYKVILIQDVVSEVEDISKWDKNVNTSNIVEVTCSSSRSMKQNNELMDIDLHPNPAKEYIILTIPEKIQTFKYSILDVHGRLLSENRNSRFINVSEFPQGAYYLKFESSELHKTVKFIVSH